MGWFVVVVVALPVAGIFLGVALHRAKTRRLRLFAHQHGWRFVPMDRALVGRYDGAPFGRGSGRRASYVVSGPHRGTWFVAFEYRYTESRGESSRTHRFTVVAIDLPARRPRLEITRGTPRFPGRSGMRDLRPARGRFSDAFHVSTDDERFAHAVLHPRTTEWLLANGRYALRFGGDHLLAWSRGTIEPGTAATMLDHVCDLRDRIPTSVWRTT